MEPLSLIIGVVVGVAMVILTAVILAIITAVLVYMKYKNTSEPLCAVHCMHILLSCAACGDATKQVLHLLM